MQPAESVSDGTAYPDALHTLEGIQSAMFYTTNFQRYLAELLLFTFLVFIGLAVNSQTLIALGILVLCHCLPSLVLATLRQLTDVNQNNIPTYYSNGYCSFREKEIVDLISSALMIGVSLGLLALSLQKLTFVPLSDAQKTTILGLAYIACELTIYVLVSLTSKNSPLKKPRKSRVMRILVALLAIVIAHIEHQLLQELIDTVVGLGVLGYVLYHSARQLAVVALKNINYAPRGIDVEDVRLFLLAMPGVVGVSKIFFRRINEIEHELGVQLSMEHYLRQNAGSGVLRERIKQQVQTEFGVSGVTMELQWTKLKNSAKPSSMTERTRNIDNNLQTKLDDTPESTVIVLGHQT